MSVHLICDSCGHNLPLLGPATSASSPLVASSTSPSSPTTPCVGSRSAPPAPPSAVSSVPCRPAMALGPASEGGQPKRHPGQASRVTRDMKTAAPAPAPALSPQPSPTARPPTSPVVSPKFKISRGTQVASGGTPINARSPGTSSCSRASSRIGDRDGISPTPPPVPPKPSNLCFKATQTATSTSSNRSGTPPKPALPPKPLHLPTKPRSPPAVRPIISLDEKVVGGRDSASTSPRPNVKLSPQRPPRSRATGSTPTTPTADAPSPPVETFTVIKASPILGAAKSKAGEHQSRKSSSLGRLESLCCALFVGHCDDPTVSAVASSARNLQRDSGFVSSSLECVDRLPVHQCHANQCLPVAPPRRRRKSADSYRDKDAHNDTNNEPIYAVVDFSKKINRRSLFVDPVVKEPAPVRCLELAAESTMEPPVKIIEPQEQVVQPDETPMEQPVAMEETQSTGGFVLEVPKSPSQHSHLDIITEVLSSSSEKVATSGGEENLSASSDVDISAMHSQPEILGWQYVDDRRDTDAPVDPPTESPTDWPTELPSDPVQTSPQRAMNSDIESIESSFATITSIFGSLVTRSSCDPAVPPESPPDAPGPSLTTQVVDGAADVPLTVTIARLVVGGAVIQQADVSLVAECQQSEGGQKTRIKEFRTVLEDVLKSQPAGSTEQPHHPRQEGGQRERNRKRASASPTPSTGSCGSNESNGAAPVDADAFEDADELSAGILGDVESDAARQSSIDDDGDAHSEDATNPFGVRRALGALFQSFNRTGGRRAVIKRKVVHHDSSSTDTDNPRSHRSHGHRGSGRGHSHRLIKGNMSVAALRDQFTRSGEFVAKNQPPTCQVENDNYAEVVAEFSSLTDGQGGQWTAPSRIVGKMTDSFKKTIPPDGDGVSVASSHRSLESSQETSERMSRSHSDSDPDINGLSKLLEGKAKKAYLTACEICSSERIFVDCLRLICDDFRAAVQAANAEGTKGPVIPDGELNRILSYLPHLQNLNQELLDDFELRIRNWIENPRIADVIIRKGPFLKLYSAYIRDFQAQSLLLEECIQKYSRFAKTLKQFEATERCKSLSLKHYMLKPIQRLPQYRLLLDQYLKYQDAETCPDYQNTVAALKVVTEVADHANNSMKHEDNFMKLMQLQSRLGNCEIIKPGRSIIKEGELQKVSRKTLQPRYLILLNDCLLYTSYVGSPSSTGSLRLHHELPLQRMQVDLPATEDYENEFNVISTTRSFTLVSSSAQMRDEWISVLKKAINDFQSKQLTFMATRNAPVVLNEEPVRIGQQAPVWIPDSRVTMCQLCTAAFTVTFRRHHCRACGKVVCSGCSSHKSALEYLKGRAARVCDVCYSAITEEASPGEGENDSSACSSMALDSCSIESSVQLAPVQIIKTVSSAYQEKRPSSDPLAQPAARAGLQAQVRRQHGRKERRYIPQRLMEVSANDAGSQMSGYLSWRTRRSWKKYWFVLKDRVLYLYKASEDVVALDTIPVLGYSVQIPSEDVDGIEKELVFQLFHATQRPIIFHAETATISKKWIEALSTATVL